MDRERRGQGITSGGFVFAAKCAVDYDGQNDEGGGDGEDYPFVYGVQTETFLFRFQKRWQVV